MNKENKRAQICAVGWMLTDDAEIDNYLGEHRISISGDWLDMGISSAEFKESQTNGEMAQQELKVTIADSSEENEKRLRGVVYSEIILRIDYTNGDSLVVGTNTCPVRISMERSGSPGKLVLSVKRSSPEPSKFLRSF